MICLVLDSVMAAPLPKPHYSTPSNNYLSGDGKSLVYEGSGYYVPSERGRWIKTCDYRYVRRYLPPPLKSSGHYYVIGEGQGHSSLKN